MHGNVLGFNHRLALFLNRTSRGGLRKVSRHLVEFNRLYCSKQTPALSEVGTSCFRTFCKKIFGRPLTVLNNPHAIEINLAESKNIEMSTARCFPYAVMPSKATRGPW